MNSQTKTDKARMAEKSSVADFSEQWTDYTAQIGYYASPEMLADYVGPLLTTSELENRTVCEVGCGNGRFLKIFSEHASHVLGVEPSEAAHIAEAYVSEEENVRVIKQSIYDLSVAEQFDVVFCLGVLHHLPDPVAAVRALHRLTKPGGTTILWVYGREGNKAYIYLVHALRTVTTRLPHRYLKILSRLLVYPLKAYIACCRWIRLPLAEYMRAVLGRYDSETLELSIYDQLNPTIAEYWTKEQFERILQRGGYAHIRLYHRHGYSWTARLEKPSDP